MIPPGSEHRLRAPEITAWLARSELAFAALLAPDLPGQIWLVLGLAWSISAKWTRRLLRCDPPAPPGLERTP